MEGTETCTAIARISEEQMVSSHICYTNRGMLEIIVNNESPRNERLYYEVRNYYSDAKLATGVVEAGKTEKYCIKISEEIHLVSAAHVLISSLSPGCCGFALLRGLIDYNSPPIYSDQVAYYQAALDITLENHVRQIAK